MLAFLVFWRSLNVYCPNCNEKQKQAALGSVCGICKSDITPWATIGWPIEIEPPSSSSVKSLASSADDSYEPRALRSIEEEMLIDFSGQRMTAANVCELFNERYSEVECLDALQFLEKADLILVDPELKYRDSPEVPSGAVILFPKKKKQKRR